MKNSWAVETTFYVLLYALRVDLWVLPNIWMAISDLDPYLSICKMEITVFTPKHIGVTPPKLLMRARMCIMNVFVCMYGHFHK